MAVFVVGYIAQRIDWCSLLHDTISKSRRSQKVSSQRALKEAPATPPKFFFSSLHAQRCTPPSRTIRAQRMMNERPRNLKLSGCCYGPEA